MITVNCFSNGVDVKKHFFMYEFVEYTNKLAEKTGKKISSLDRLKTVFKHYKENDWRSDKPTFKNAADYPTLKELLVYLNTQCIG